MKLRTILDGYKEAILFAERDLNAPEDDDTTLDSEGYSIHDFNEEADAALRSDVAVFCWANRATLREAFATGYSETQAGHDLYFTQAGHGVGFWDRGLGDIGDRLSDACAWREFGVYSTPDGRLAMD